MSACLLWDGTGPVCHSNLDAKAFAHPKLQEVRSNWSSSTFRLVGVELAQNLTMSFVTWAKKTSEGKNLYRDEDVIIIFIFICIFMLCIYIYTDSFFLAQWCYPQNGGFTINGIEMVVFRIKLFTLDLFCCNFHQGDVQNALKVFPEYADIQFVWISCATKKKLDVQTIVSALKWQECMQCVFDTQEDSTYMKQCVTSIIV